ncbi:cysteine peptidase family C39 domain-containing protein [Bremerella sp. JC770]|uniref:cysteine peptidase family C39 domain-containing protein n=1 Tax=Bremerella sp. JC770 TaxID=3232137 RepID=UPI00345953B6
MQDVIAGYFIVGVISLGGFFATRAWTKDWSVTGLNQFSIIVLALVGLYTAFVWESLYLTELLPFSNLIILSNVYPLAALTLAAIASNRLRDRGWRRVVPMSGLLGAGVWSLVYPIMGQAPECQMNWDTQGICYQTTDQTCTAACAATLLNYYEISTTEEEMAELCLTRQGTSWKGFYRGLKLKTKDSPYQVRMDYLTPQELAVAGRPVVLRVGKRSWFGSVNAAGLPDGWNVGEIHSVVCLGQIQGYYVIADPNPDIGIEFWSEEELSQVWDGHSARLEHPYEGPPFKHTRSGLENIRSLAAF